jgi:hypothetical protein
VVIPKTKGSSGNDRERKGIFEARLGREEKSWQVFWNHEFDDAAIRETFCEGNSRARGCIARLSLSFEIDRGKTRSKNGRHMIAQVRSFARYFQSYQLK